MSSALKGKAGGWRRLGEWVAVFSALLLASAAVAGPLKKAWVDGDAHWVFHLDMEGLVASSLGPLVLEAFHDGEDDKLLAFLRDAGVDPARDLKSVTVYAFGGEPKDAVAIVVGTAAMDELAARLAARFPSFERIAEEPYPKYTWMEDGAARYGQIMPGPQGSRVAVVARDAVHLAGAATVIEGASASLETVKSGPLSRTPRASSFLFAMARVEGARRAGKAAMVTRMTESFVFEAGEDPREAYATLTLAIREGRDAASIVQIFNGMLAMARLAVSGDPELEEVASMLEMVEMTVEGSEVSVRIGIGSERVRELVEATTRLERTWRKHRDEEEGEGRRGEDR
jgi:hypothetical protein